MPSPATAPAIESPTPSLATSVGAHKLQAVPPLPEPVIPPVRRRRGRPPRLSRPAIFQAALRLIDAEGAGALTMRRLGAEMGVEAMSLYRHVSSKDALLDGIGEQLMAELEIDPEDRGWETTASRLSDGIRAVAQAHPAAYGLVGLRALNTVEAMRPVEALLAALREGGFPADRAIAAFRLLSAYSRGYALSEVAGFTLVNATKTEDRLTGDKLPADEFPAIHDLAEMLAADPTDGDFRSGIETILAGLRQELAAITAGRDQAASAGAAKARRKPAGAAKA
jgi:AcrR family transcriptional regulator